MEATAAMNLPPLPEHAARREPKKPETADPRVRRFGLNPGIYNLTVSPLASGLPDRVIPAGKLLLFETWDPVRPNFEAVIGMAKGPSQVRKEKTAAQFINNVKIRGGSRGFTELDPLTPLTDDEARYVFYSVHPFITDCPNKLEDCVTCRLRQLDELDITELPTTATIRNEQGQQEIVTVSRDIFRALRANLIASYTKFRAWAQDKYDTKVSEIEGRRNGEPGVAKLKAAEHYYRKHLHLQRPEDIEKEVAAKLGEANARETRAGFAAITEGFKDVIKAVTGRNEADPVREKELALLSDIADKMKQLDKPEPEKRGPGRPPKQTEE